MKIIIEAAQSKAAQMRQIITRMDIQYNYNSGEYAGYVVYTNGDEYIINERGQITKRN